MHPLSSRTVSLCCLRFIGIFLLLLRWCDAAIDASSFDATTADLGQFRYCMRQAQHPSLRECIGRTAISFLQRFDDRENVTLTRDFVSTKDDKIAARSLVNVLDSDPVDFRGILENAGAIFSQRSLEWHMDTLYPGLMFKIGPTADAKSVAEFVLDPAIDERNFGAYEEPSTARVLAKQYLLPFLLGLKFNLVALVPLLFAGICLLLKKSLFFVKLAIYVSSLLGVGGTLGALGSIGGFGAGGGGFGGLGGGGFGGLGGLIGAHGHAHALGAAGAPSGAGGGYFPGKTTVFNNYEADEFHHNSPYKRNDRKVNFDKPPREREYVARSTMAAPTSSVVSDHFYEYEKQVMLQDRSGKLRAASGKLGPSAFEDDEAAENHSFKTSDRNGWKVVDLRT